MQPFSMELNTRSLMINGSIYYVLYLHIVCFYFVGQIEQPNLPPLSKNAVSTFQISCKQTIFFNLGRFLKKLADDQCSSITKGSIYHVICTYIQPFTIAVDWPQCFIFADTEFLPGAAELVNYSCLLTIILRSYMYNDLKKTKNHLRIIILSLSMKLVLEDKLSGTKISKGFSCQALYCVC